MDTENSGKHVLTTVPLVQVRMMCHLDLPVTGLDWTPYFNCLNFKDENNVLIDKKDYLNCGIRSVEQRLRNKPCEVFFRDRSQK